MNSSAHIEPPPKQLRAVEMKFGGYTSQEDKVVRNAITNPTFSARAVATLLHRTVGSVNNRIKKLRREKVEKKEESDTDSMDVLEKFLAVEEESSVDIDTAADALDWKPPTSNDVPATTVTDVGPTGAAAVFTTCDDLVSLDDLSYDAISFLCAAADQVQQEKEEEKHKWRDGELDTGRADEEKGECADESEGKGGGEGEWDGKGDDGTLSDSGASTFAEVL